MSRSSRLLDLIQLLRSHRRPVSGRVLADRLGISLRTLYVAVRQGAGGDDMVRVAALGTVRP